MGSLFIRYTGPAHEIAGMSAIARELLVVYVPLVLGLGFVLWIRRHDLRRTIPIIIVLLATPAVAWFLFKRFPGLLTHQPLVIGENLHRVIVTGLLVYIVGCSG